MNSIGRLYRIPYLYLAIFYCYFCVFLLYVALHKMVHGPQKQFAVQSSEQRAMQRAAGGRGTRGRLWGVGGRRSAVGGAGRGRGRGRGSNS